MRQPEDARTRQLFSIAEAARHAGTTPATVRAWLCGDPESGFAPLFDDRPHQPGAEVWLSFLELVEVIVARRFRRHRVSLDQLRHARQHLRHRWQVAYPLAERHLRLLGGRVLDSPDGGVDIEYPATQPALPDFAELATDVFEYEALADPARDAAWAVRFYPAGVEVPLMIDPRFAGGALVFRNRGITLENVIQRRKAGEPAPFIASDLALEPEDLTAALQYAGLA